MALKIVCSFTFDNVHFVEYECEEIGDGIPLHDHAYNHLTKCTGGQIECYGPDGRSVTCRPGDPPIEYRPGTKHGIRGVTPRAMFMNISPQRH